jgi:hypothetical protein
MRKLFKLGITALTLLFLAGCGGGGGGSSGTPGTTGTNASVPSITAQPADATYVQGDTPTPLSVTASVGDGGALSYEWYSNTIDSNSGGTAISGATSSYYTPSTAAVGTTYYYVVVTNTNNAVNGVKTVNAASLTSEIVVNPGVTTYHTVSFYDENLSFVDSVSVPEGDIVPSSVKSGTWYKAGESTAAASHTLTQDINFYAAKNVFEITDQEGLDYIRYELSGKHILLNDIALVAGKAGVDPTRGWEPVGTSTASFQGIFNGNSHKITGFWLDRSTDHTDHTGLFGYTKSAVIKNIGVEISDKNIQGYYAVGAIVGSAFGTRISNVYSVGGSISIRDNGAGGIAGFIEESSSISNAYSTVNVSGSNYVGGIAGAVRSSTISNSFASGRIRSNFGSGGITAKIYSGSTVVNNVAVNSEVTVVAIANPANRIIGYIDGTNHSYTNNFALDTIVVNGITNKGYAGTSKTITQLRTKGTYSGAVNGNGLGGLGWKFGNDDNNPWKIDAAKNNGLPYLYWID